MKLQEGDYVKNLTEKQWNELLDIENNSRRYTHIYDHNDIDTKNYFKNGFVYSDSNLLHSKKSACKQELTFRQFKGRAKNTFSHG
jgi:hypothetical protein